MAQTTQSVKRLYVILQTILPVRLAPVWAGKRSPLATPLMKKANILGGNNKLNYFFNKC